MLHFLCYQVITNPIYDLFFDWLPYVSIHLFWAVGIEWRYGVTVAVNIGNFPERETFEWLIKLAEEANKQSNLASSCELVGGKG